MEKTYKLEDTRKYHSTCPICKGTKLKYWFSLKGYTITKCMDCGVSFVKEQVSQRELDFHYGKAAESMSPIEDCVYLNDENVENLNYYFTALRSFIAEKMPAGKILDIGCNTGSFLDVMKGYECYGLDRSPAHGNIAKKKYGDNIYIGSFEDYKVPDFLFDCITLQDVMDHMSDPVEALKKCNRMLKPGGLLIVKVHDLSSLYAKISGKNFYAFLPPMHLFYFTRSSLRKTLESASFKVLFFKHLAHLMFISTVFYRLARGDENSIFFKIYKKLEGTRFGSIKIKKNLHDIITVFAVKK